MTARKGFTRRSRRILRELMVSNKKRTGKASLTKAFISNNVTRSQWCWCKSGRILFACFCCDSVPNEHVSVVIKEFGIFGVNLLHTRLAQNLQVCYIQTHQSYGHARHETSGQSEHSYTQCVQPKSKRPFVSEGNIQYSIPKSKTLSASFSYSLNTPGETSHSITPLSTCLQTKSYWVRKDSLFTHSGVRQGSQRDTDLGCAERQCHQHEQAPHRRRNFLTWDGAIGGWFKHTMDCLVCPHGSCLYFSNCQVLSRVDKAKHLRDTILVLGMLCPCGIRLHRFIICWYFTDRFSSCVKLLGSCFDGTRSY